MRSAIVTGADGFICSHLIRELLQHDVKVTAVILPGFENHPRILPIRDSVNLVTWDYRSADEIQGKMPDADVLYHFAWQGVAPEKRKLLQAQLPNIQICLNTMELAVRKKVRKFIFPGSTNEYMYCQEPISSQSKPNADNAYGAVKLAARFLCREFAAEHQISFIYSVIAGIYSEDRRDSNVVFYVIDCLLKGISPELTALQQKVNYVHIDDVVNGLYLIGEKGKKDWYGIGSEENLPLCEYIEQIHKLVAPEAPLGIGRIPYKPGTKLPHSMVDITEIVNDVGYAPGVSFQNGIQRVIQKIKDSCQ